MNWFPLTYLILVLIGLNLLSYPYFVRDESSFSRSNVAREIQANCEPSDLVGIARDGHIITIYRCEEHYR